MALSYKTYHEWGYTFNESGTVGELTSYQRGMILLAEKAETYIEYQQSQRRSRSRSRSRGTRSGRQSLDERYYNPGKSRQEFLQGWQ